MIKLSKILSEIKILGKVLILRVDPRLNLFYFDTNKGNRAYYQPNSNGSLLIRWPYNDNNRATEEEIMEILDKFRVKYKNDSHYLPITMPQVVIKLEGKLRPMQPWQNDPRYYILQEIKIIPNITPEMVIELYENIINSQGYQSGDISMRAPKIFIKILKKYFNTSLDHLVLEDIKEIKKLSQFQLNKLYKELNNFYNDLSKK